jgi:hypothetical protein
MGVRRVPTGSATSGLWFQNEQSVARRAGIWPGSTVDPNFADVSLLLHMDGSNGSTTFTDNSANAFTVTANGNAQISTAQAKFGGASGSFDGTDDYLSIANASALQMDTSNFTIEFWIYWNSIPSYSTVLSKGYVGAGSLLLQTSQNTGRLSVFIGGSSVIAESGTAPASTWISYALVKDGSTITLYRDGTSSGTATNSTSINNTSTLYIGAGLSSPDYFVNGYIDELRITKGVARYTSNYTVATSRFPDA